MDRSRRTRFEIGFAVMPEDPDLVVMLLADLATAPRRDVPVGHSIRRFEPGDGLAWVAIHRAADGDEEHDADQFAHEFGGSQGDLRDRQFFALDAQEQPIGTATAWFAQPETSRALGRLGRLHWLAVVPEHQRLGVGSALTSAVLDRLLDLGGESAYLTSSVRRQGALRFHEQFGFVRTPVRDVLAVEHAT